MVNDLSEAVDTGRHNRLSRGHRLQQDNAEALVPGCRRAKDVAAGVVAGKLLRWHIAGHDHVVELLAGKEVAVPAAQRTITDDDQAQLWVLRLELGEGAKQIAQALSIFEAPDEKQIAHAVAELGVGRLVLKTPGIDAV